MEDLVTENVGAEYDNEVWRSLRSAISKLNGKIVDEHWALAGSQELSFFEVDIEGHKIEVESETYIDVSISGPSPLIKRIRDTMKDA